MATVSCIDLSHHNEPTSFHDAFASGIRLVMLKATQGSGYTDPTFAERVKRVQSVPGLMVGAYHFGDGSDHRRQVDHFLTVAGDLPLLCLDWEQNESGPTMARRDAEAFVTDVQAKTNAWPLLYGGSLLKAVPLAKSSPLLNCELWLSQYASTAVLPRGWKSWRLWQFTDGDKGPLPHSVPGIGHCDINKFNGSLDDLARWYEARRVV